MANSLEGFYQGKRVVVTGGAGMIGFQLVTLLSGLGADVMVVDDFSRGKNVVKAKNVTYAPFGDASHPPACELHFKDAFAVFNLAAAVAGVQYNQESHMEMFFENMKLQTVPLMAAAKLKIPHFLQVSSVCIYSPNHNHPAVERDGMVGEPHVANYGYGWSKRMGENMATKAGLEHVVIVRPSNVYGPRDYFDEKAHVIPNLIKKCMADGPITMHSPPNVTREFIFSSDVAMGMLVALARGEHGEAYNIGTNGDTCVTIENLLSRIQDAVGSNHPVIWGRGPDYGDLARYSNASKLNKLGWEHLIRIEAGIGLVVDWYKETLKNGATKS